MEDDAVTRAILTAQLNQLGFAASEATSATEALDLLRRQRFALAIIDLRIGGSDGVTILRHHRRSSHANPEMQAIAISARIDHALEQQLRQAGFAAWLPKPVTLTHLKKAIRTCLSASRGIPGGREEDTPRDRRLGQVQQAVQMKFLSELPRQLAMIENAVGQRQWRLALEIAHKLQGAAGFCRFGALRQLAADLEAALRQKNDEDCLIVWQRLQQEAKDLLTHGLDDRKDQT